MSMEYKSCDYVLYLKMKEINMLGEFLMTIFERVKDVRDEEKDISLKSDGKRDEPPLRQYAEGEEFPFA